MASNGFFQRTGLLRDENSGSSSRSSSSSSHQTSNYGQARNPSTISCYSDSSRSASGSSWASLRGATSSSRTPSLTYSDFLRADRQVAADLLRAENLAIAATAEVAAAAAREAKREADRKKAEEEKRKREIAQQKRDEEKARAQAARILEAQNPSRTRSNLTYKPWNTKNL